jgi:hypothetical protein
MFLNGGCHGSEGVTWAYGAILLISLAVCGTSILVSHTGNTIAKNMDT